MCDLYTICLIARVKEAHPMLLWITEPPTAFTVVVWITVNIKTMCIFIQKIKN